MIEQKKVMIVEDQFIIALDLASNVEAAGNVVVGPFSTSEAGIQNMQSGDLPDAAILDINLEKGKTTEAIADYLLDHKIPFVFLTAYNSDDTSFSSKYKDAAFYQKPMLPQQLHDVIPQLTRPN